MTNANLGPVKPEVGMGATMGVGSDRYPYTIIEIKRNGNQLVLQADDYKMVSGSAMSESQEYEYTPNPKGATCTANWAPKRQRFLSGGSPVGIGARRAYRDPSY